MAGSTGAGFDGAERAALLGLARRAVDHGVRNGSLLPVDPAAHPERLREPRGCFVTLRLDGNLRGCTGSLEAQRPLVAEVARSAHRSALADPRFTPVDAAELPRLALHLSVLTPLEPLPAASEQALLESLEPGRDGLVLREGDAAATFLPAVWEQLPTAQEFLRELRRKAGLPADHWSEALRFQRYRAEELA